MNIHHFWKLGDGKARYVRSSEHTAQVTAALTAQAAGRSADGEDRRGRASMLTGEAGETVPVGAGGGDHAVDHGSDGGGAVTD